MSHESPTPMRRRLFAFGIAAVLLVAAIVLAAPFAIRGIAHNALAGVGFNDARGGAVSLGPRHLRISQIAIGRRGTMTVAVTFSPAGLMHGRLDTITVSDTALHAVVGLGGSVSLDGFVLPSTKPGPAEPMRLPARRASLERLSLELETPAGPATLIANGAINGIENGLRLTGSVDLTKGDVTGAVPVDFTLSPGGWSLVAAPIRVVFPGKTATIAEGHMSIGKTGDAAIAGAGQIDGRDLVVGTIPIRKLGLNFSIGAEGQSGHLELAPADGSTGVVGDFNNAASILTANLKAKFADIQGIAKASGAGAISGPLQAGITLHVDAGSPRRFTLAANYDGALPAGVMLRTAKMEATGAFDPAANTVSLSSCGGFSADTIMLASVSLSKLSGCVGPMDGPAVIQSERIGGNVARRPVQQCLGDRFIRRREPGGDRVEIGRNFRRFCRWQNDRLRCQGG